MEEDLRATATAWLEADPDPDTRAELRAVLERTADTAEQLAARFAGSLAFGTAGIRGPLGAGPLRMNRLVVRRVTAGLAARLRREPSSIDRGVVVGRDARHKSPDFADEATRVLAGAGFAVRRLAGPVPTPLVAFAVRDLDAAAGIQITASHNPPADNGYKVFWGDGAQIVAPLDTEIAEEIARVADVGAVPLADPADPRIAPVPATVEGRYVEACLALVPTRAPRNLRLVYTPLHGVAGPLLRKVFAAAGFSDVAVVPEQEAPDPDFPTVAFPNPEEPGALDLALALARDKDADLLLANDPDGDRIAAALPIPAGGWRVLSGDEVGCLLAEYLLAHGGGGGERVVLTTVVSSRLLSRIAAAHGVGHAETLTGFKWLAAEAAQVREAGGVPVLAYEQALGVMAGDAVRDKDGISAALLLAELAAFERARGRTLLDAMDDLARAHGVHATGGRSLRLEGAAGLATAGAILARLGASPPERVGGVEVTASLDYESRERRTPVGTEPLAVPATKMVGLELADGSRLQVRPSGTEPLLKFYVEVVESVAGGDVASARSTAATRLEDLADAFLALALA